MTENNNTILVNYTGRTGGGPIFAYEMTKGLIESGVKVVAIVSKDIANLCEWKKLSLDKLVCLSTYSNKINYMANSILFPIKQKKQILSELKEYRFSAIYCPMNCPWTRRINEMFKDVPSYETLHDPIPHSGETWYLRGFRVSKNTKKIIVLSEKFVEYVRKKYKKQVIWIPHGRMNYYKERYFSGTKSSKAINYLFFGRIEAYKGLRVLAEAFREVEKKLTHEYTLTIAGRGNWDEYKGYFEGLPRLRVMNRWLNDEDINLLYEYENTITILPYLDATQSGVIPVAQEYMSPIIASDVGGIREQIKDGETGMLFTAGDSKELAKCIELVDSDITIAKQLAHNAHEKLADIEWNKLAKKLVDDIDNAGGEV